MADNNDDDKVSGGGRTLGGAAEPLPSNWTRPSQQPRMGRIGAWGSNSNARPSGGARIAGLGDLGASAPVPRHQHGGHGPHQGGEDDDDEDEDPNQPQNFFAGGERSGINVQGPPRGGENNLVRDLLRKAAQGGQATPPQAERSGWSAFSGGGNTLGSDEVDSHFIPDPTRPEGEDEEEVTAYRTITFWRDGFSIEDGPLLRYDVPENARLLDDINSGHVPHNVLNVEHGQPVELRLQRRTQEDYVASPRRPGAAFHGEGQRLGAPVPTFSESTTPSIPGSFPTQPPRQPLPATASGSTTLDTMHSMRFEVDESAPVTSIRVRLADGTTLTARMNLTHTVGDIRNFILASRPGQPPFSINTTFPNKVLDDDKLTLQAGGLKNSVLVQRYI